MVYDQPEVIAQTSLKTLTYPDLAIWLEDLLRSHPTFDYQDRLLSRRSNIQKTQVQ
jgi:hypothetical protein